MDGTKHDISWQDEPDSVSDDDPEDINIDTSNEYYNDVLWPNSRYFHDLYSKAAYIRVYTVCSPFWLNCSLNISICALTWASTPPTHQIVNIS